MGRPLTWTQGLVCLVVVGVLLLMGYSAICHWLVLNQLTSALSNMKQLHLATYQLALDGQTLEDKSLGWPGDTGGTFTNWAKQIVPDYLGTNDFCKLLSATGKPVPPGKVPVSLAECGILVYAVSTNSATNTVFLSTANFTNGPEGGSPPQPGAIPYGNHGFTVFRIAGDGAILRPRQASDLIAVGSYAPLLK